MPRLLDIGSRSDAMTDAVNLLLAREGVPGLSLRAIARECRLSPATLTHRYASREHLVRVAAFSTARRRRDRLTSRIPWEGVLAFLPADPDDVVDARAWLGWCELWRSDDSLSVAIGSARADERALLARTLDYRLERPRLDALTALVDGLSVALCAPERPMSIALARSILDDQALRLAP